MKNLTLFILLFFFSISHASEKYALIVAVGDYPSKTGWNNISSKNDVPLIKQTLLSQGFNESNITILIDEQATKQAILMALKELYDKTSEGDIIVFHVSAHGQQIIDENGDEIDGLDEAIIPYDAWAKYTYKYKGENHLRDDELGVIIANLRNKLGKTGQILFLLDSCHSGSTTRGGKARGSMSAFVPDGWTPKKNGTSKGSDMFEKVKLSSNSSPFILISGASANELNYEHEGVGSLSYSFSKAMNELGNDFTYRQLFSKIQVIMNVISPRQTPTVEGDVDYKLFKGEYVTQQPYFEVISIPRINVINIRAGKLQGLFKNTTIFLLPSGTTNVKEDNIIAKGTITNTKYNESSIKLDREIKDSNEKKYWVFVDQPSYSDISLKVFFDSSIQDESLKDGISSFLNKNNLGEVVNDTLQSDVILAKDKKGEVVFNIAKDKMQIDKLVKQREEDLLSSIQEKLFNFAQGQYIKGLSMKNYDYEFEFKLIPVDVEYDEIKEKVESLKAILPEDTYINEAGIFEVQAEKDFVFLQVTNRSNTPIYFNIIEVNSKGEINPFMPTGDCNLNNNERLLAPGKTMLFKDCYYSFGPPYERLILKGFATPTPINFQFGSKTRSSSNPLEKFMGGTYSHSRGSKSTKTSKSMKVYTTEFVYEIVK
ncbi:caspase family protein [Aureibaculum sp. 2210JD6-5]|uniref:caspase family protein n=1 Tax=Aureibaculum sp. 2210JD6-5 TaxID=3103957 RepID=UPI002AAE2385|nr:caspase family protein [Aureibaculum sp. 2210JD6-5]MDY7396305.1 caspase family protein [Aureibaculum sp. 2210JD6-5]